MTIAAVLLGYAASGGFVVPRLLLRLRWLDRSPRLGLLVWQSLIVSLVAATALAGVALAIPSVGVSGGLAELLHACVAAIRSRYATPGGAATAIVGLALALVVMLRGGAAVVRLAVRSARARARHRESLAILGRTDAEGGFTVVDHWVPTAYCVPGLRPQIVVTSAARSALDEAQLRAVLAHERAHLAGRHGLQIGFAAAMAQAFPGVPLFGVAAREVARLAEVVADEAAARSVSRCSVARALVALAGTPAPEAALAAGGPDATARVERLLGEPRPLGRLPTATLAVTVVAVLAVPLVVTFGGLWGARAVPLCPVSHAPVARA